MILVFDIETNKLDKHARIIQIAWILCDYNRQIIREKNYYVYSPDLKIEKSSTNVHGLTIEIVKKLGVTMKEVLRAFLQDLNNADIVVGHNINQFDIPVTEYNFLLAGLDHDIFKNKLTYDTLLQSIDFCALPNPYRPGYKYPKLTELYYKLFQRNFTAHNAMKDTRATYDCFWALVDEKVINLNLNFNERKEEEMTEEKEAEFILYSDENKSKFKEFLRSYEGLNINQTGLAGLLNKAGYRTDKGKEINRKFVSKIQQIFIDDEKEIQEPVQEDQETVEIKEETNLPDPVQEIKKPPVFDHSLINNPSQLLEVSNSIDEQYGFIRSKKELIYNAFQASDSANQNMMIIQFLANKPNHLNLNWAATNFFGFKDENELKDRANKVIKALSEV